MHLLKIDQVTKSRGASFHLGPLNLKLSPGEILGIMGPNGAGKTTLLRLLWGFLRPDQGTISVLGLVPHLHQVRMRRQAGFVADSTRFYDWMSVTRYLAFVAGFYPSVDKQHTGQLLDRLGLRSSENIANLSGGERVKLALISAVAHRPNLLFLDEPTAGLAPPARNEFLGILKDMAASGMGVVLSSHISNDLDRIADSILMLEGGRAIECTPAQILPGKDKGAHLEDDFLNAIKKVSTTCTSHRA